MTINWKNDVPLPMARPRYYDHQYLRAADLTQAVDYLLSRQHLTARLRQPVGVVSGLELTATGGDVTVAEGAAVDADGLLIVVPAGRRVSPPGDGTFHVTLRYSETLTDRRDEGGVAAETRWTEEGRVELTTAPPADPGRAIVLGRVVRSQGVVTVQATGRLVAGLRVPAGAIVPSVGNSPQAGIQFPANAGGGVGDEAFIRYWAAVGENTVLRIGNNNDPDDAITFHQAGADRLRISQSMLHLGSLDGTAVQADQVVASLGFWGPGVQHGQLSFRAGRGFELVDSSTVTPSLGYPLHSREYADLEVRELRAARVRGRGGLNLLSDGQVAVRAGAGLFVVKEAGSSGNLTVQGALGVGGNVNLPASGYLAGAGRLHLSGPERLFLLNTQGVYVGHGGSSEPDAGCLWVEKRGLFGGDLQVNGRLGVKTSPNSIPDWSGGGVSTFDLFVSGAMYAGPVGGPYPISLEAASGKIVGRTKQFVIDHPLDDPADPDRRLLVHAALEGPENGVYYRGEGRLVDGAATVDLPEYFEALTRLEGRTVQLTPVFDDDEPVSALAASRVTAGEFRVRTVDGSKASHAFFWQVSAVRADLDPLVAEVPAAAPHTVRPAPAATDPTPDPASATPTAA
ncbi:hypothetical protein ABT023_24160 [Micromonospora sp. NPDC002296]|uniref:hypothetical protein n=1 Tax=Micromonospora sp. NPDC002296 TaxID=3154271 RepID=UPI00332278A3